MKRLVAISETGEKKLLARQHMHVLKNMSLILLCASFMPSLLNAQILNAPPRQTSPSPQPDPPSSPPVQPRPQAESGQSGAVSVDDADDPPVSYAAVHGTWLITCVGEEEIACFVETQVRRNDGSERDLVRLQFTMASSGEESWLQMSLSTPNNVLIPPHARIHLGENVFNAPYTICDAQYCVAEVAVAQPLLNGLIAESSGHVVFTMPTSQNTRVPIRLNGFLEALSDMNSQLGASQTLSERHDG